MKLPAGDTGPRRKNPTVNRTLLHFENFTDRDLLF